MYKFTFHREHLLCCPHRVHQQNYSTLLSKTLRSLVLVDPIAVNAKRSCLSFKMRQTDGTQEYLALFLSLILLPQNHSKQASVEFSLLRNSIRPPANRLVATNTARAKKTCKHKTVNPVQHVLVVTPPPPRLCNLVPAKRLKPQRRVPCGALYQT